MRKSLATMRTFLVVWAGQFVSMLGSGIARFALMIWVWNETGEATAFVLVGISGTIAGLIAKAIAGPLVDRWNRKRVMLVGDLIAALCSLTVLLLYASGNLEVWHLYVTSAVAGFSGTFQSLAYTASRTLIMPKAEYTRAMGLITLSEYASLVGAPLLAGLLIAPLGIGGILLIDIVTFLIAAAMLLRVHIPQPLPTVHDDVPRPFLRDALSGLGYIVRRRGLLGILLIATFFSFVESLGYPLILPMLLARTGDEALAGNVLAMQGVGGVLGAVLVSVWGGPKRRIHGVLLGIILTGLLGDALMGLGQSLPVWFIAAIGLEIFIPVTIGSYFSLWQTKCEPGLQGRIFAARDLISTVGDPLAMVTAGLLVDNVLEPAMQPGGSLAGVFGGLVGVGSGAGMALLLVLGGVLTAVVGAAGYLIRPVRDVDRDLPDHDLALQPQTTA